jgi:hypothetical protein
MHCQSEGTGERTLVGLEAGAGHAIAFTSGSATTATVLQSPGPNAHILSVSTAVPRQGCKENREYRDDICRLGGRNR